MFLGDVARPEEEIHAGLHGEILRWERMDRDIVRGGVAACVPERGLSSRVASGGDYPRREGAVAAGSDGDKPRRSPATDSGGLVKRILLLVALAIVLGLGVYVWRLRAAGQLGLMANYWRNVFEQPQFPVAGPQDDDPDPVKLGIGARIGKRLFPDDDPWNRDISLEPVDPLSEQIIVRIGRNKPLHPEFGTFYNGVPNGIPYDVVGADQPMTPIEFSRYGGQSDPGPYPVPPNAPIEGGPKSTGDRHVLVLDRSAWKLYELFDAHPRRDGGWLAASGAVYDLKSSNARPLGWTSADAAGLPILPGLVRYDEVHLKKEIDHALRFTVVRSRAAYVPPARHYASDRSDVDLPPMGMRVRLRADYDLAGFSPECQVVLRALKKYGMILADNGGDWFLSGGPDPRWNDFRLRELMQVKGKDFEVVKMHDIHVGD